MDCTAACAAQDAAALERPAETAELFRSRGDFKDSAERAKACRKTYEKKAAKEIVEGEAAGEARRNKPAAEKENSPRAACRQGSVCGNKKANIEARGPDGPHMDP